MARIAVGCYLVRFPVGGYFSWVLEWMIGFHRLGHHVTLVEKAGWTNACFDPERQMMSDDCTYGTSALRRLHAHHGLEKDWCFVDASGTYHGLSREEVAARLRSADVFVDVESHGEWAEEAAACGARVLIDGEPGYTQMKMVLAQERGDELPAYDHYFTVGANIGTPASTAPTAGKAWRHVFYPVNVDLIEMTPVRSDASFTTVMSWSVHAPLTFEGRTFGHKDVEFPKFVDLPSRTRVPLEIAVTGASVPRAELEAGGWIVRDAHDVTMTYTSYMSYIQRSLGEFSVCKNVFAATHTGWFSERSGTYLASGRPVVVQETGFSAHLPCGDGLFAVSDVTEAAEAIERIAADPQRHGTVARSTAKELLDAPRALRDFLGQLGVS